jgi:hypothetical protein
MEETGAVLIYPDTVRFYPHPDLRDAHSFAIGASTSLDPKPETFPVHPVFSGDKHQVVITVEGTTEINSKTLMTQRAHTFMVEVNKPTACA